MSVPVPAFPDCIRDAGCVYGLFNSFDIFPDIFRCFPGVFPSSLPICDCFWSRVLFLYLGPTSLSIVTKLPIIFLMIFRILALSPPPSSLPTHSSSTTKVRTETLKENNKIKWDRGNVEMRRKRRHCDIKNSSKCSESDKRLRWERDRVRANWPHDKIHKAEPCLLSNATTFYNIYWARPNVPSESTSRQWSEREWMNGGYSHYSQ